MKNATTVNAPVLIFADDTKHDISHIGAGTIIILSSGAAKIVTKGTQANTIDKPSTITAVKATVELLTATPGFGKDPIVAPTAGTVTPPPPADKVTTPTDKKKGKN